MGGSYKFAGCTKMCKQIEMPTHHFVRRRADRGTFLDIKSFIHGKGPQGDLRFYDSDIYTQRNIQHT